MISTNRRGDSPICDLGSRHLIDSIPRDAGGDSGMTLKCGIAFTVLILLSIVARSAFAVTAEVAKKCGVLTAQAYPPRVPGNPAAGLIHGTAAEASGYFRKCVENRGSVKENKERAPQ